MWLKYYKKRGFYESKKDKENVFWLFLHDMSKEASKRSRAGKIFRFLTFLLLFPVIIIWAIFLLLYIPPIQEFSVKKICNVVNEQSDYNISIGAFHLAFPLKIVIDDFTLSKEDTIVVNGEQLAMSIHPIPLIKGNIEINYISIDNTKLHSGNMIDGVVIDGVIGHFRTVARDVDISNEKVDIRQLHISDTSFDITLKEASTEEDSTKNEFNWIFNLRKGNINNLSLRLFIPQDSINISAYISRFSMRNAEANIGKASYTVESLSVENSSAKYDKGQLSDTIAPLEHLHFEDINIITDKVKYSPTEIISNIESFTLKQEEGIEIEEGYLYAFADTTNIELKRILFRSKNGTDLTGASTLPRSMTSWQEKESIKGNISLSIDKRDLKRFITPQVYSRLDLLPNSMLNMEMYAGGNLKRIDIDTLNVNIPDIAHLNAKGTVQNIIEKERREAEIFFSGELSDVCHFIYSGNRPDSIAPRALAIAGRASMLGDEYTTEIQATSNESLAHATATYNSEKERYSATANVANMQVANILPQIPLRRLNLHADIDGEGINLFDSLTNYRCNIFVDDILYDTIEIEDVALHAEQANSISNVKLLSNDQNLNLQFIAKTVVEHSKIENNSKLTLTNANFEYFGITKAPLDVGMQIEISASTDMQEKHRLKLSGNNFKLVTQKRTFTPAPLTFFGITSPDTTYVDISTGDLKVRGELSSGYKKLLASVDRISQMYSKGRTNENTLYNVRDYENEFPEVSIDIECGQKNILANYLLFNNIKFRDFSFQCNHDSVKGVNVRADLHALEKDGFTLDTIRFFVRQDSTVVKYFAGVRSTTLDPEKKKLQFSSALFGNLDNDMLKTNFVFRDDRERIGARIGLNTLLKPEEVRFHFDPKAIFMNHDFHFNEDNYLIISKELAIDGNIELSDSLGAGIHVYTTPDSLQIRNINAELSNIDLKAITSLMPFAPDVSGTLNAMIHYSDGRQGMFASGDIRGTEIAYEGTPIGDEKIEIAYLPQSNNMHYIDLSLYHNGSEILALNGDFHNNKKQPAIDGDLELMQFPLKISNAFIKESGLHVGGNVDGKLSVKGPIEETEANGFIGFDSVYVDAPMFGTRLHLVDDKVAIIDNKLTFKNFDIYAKGSTPFNINGTVDFNRLLDPTFNLRMQANNYELVNSTRRKGTMLYGRLFLNTNAYVGGTLSAMRIFGSATVLGKSDITYVLQNSPLANDNELDGLVEFVNFSDTTKTVVKEEEVTDFGNMSINMNLQIEEGARLNADFDESRNSYIELQGEGGLNLTYTNESGMSMTGRYTLSNGQLKYTLPIIPLKTFSISEGSYINWTGDIANPTLNITALERVVASVTMDDGGTQAVEFDVGVVLTNTLSNMGLSFTLSAPENATVQNELNSIDKETMNKYAVTMLITGAYLGSNGGITVSNAISSFLDAKINDLAGDAMKSVNINVGITDVENAQTGDTYKNYSFSFSKRFWNDRLTVIIGGEVNSGKNVNENSNESFINNVSLEWKISESGNRYIRLFYDKNYESILEGEIIETGVGYVYKRKLNNLKELLIFRRKDNEPKAPNAVPKTRKE